MILPQTDMTDNYNNSLNTEFRWNPEWQINTETLYSAFCRFLYINYTSGAAYDKYVKSSGTKSFFLL